MIRSFFRTFRFMLSHPIGRRQPFKTLTRWLRWQAGSRLLRWPVAAPFISSTRLLLRTGMRGATMNLYVGLWEFEDMAFLMHLLRPGDRFIDIGANVGTYTVLAAGIRQAHVIAIEPVPDTYQALLDNIHLNRLDDKVVAHNVGLAAREGKLPFSVSEGPTNHVLTTAENSVPAACIPVKRLDDLAADYAPTAVKIDVEGFEQEVIRGGQGVLSSKSLMAMIVELNQLGARYGIDNHTTDAMLRNFGFSTVKYDPFRRHLEMVALPNSSGNTLYIRPSEEMQLRLRTSPPLDVYGIRI